MKFTKTVVSVGSAFAVLGIAGGATALTLSTTGASPTPTKPPAVVRQAVVVTGTAAPVTAPATVPAVPSSTPPTQGAPVTDQPSNPPADPGTSQNDAPPVTTPTTIDGHLAPVPPPAQPGQHGEPGQKLPRAPVIPQPSTSSAG